MVNDEKENCCCEQSRGLSSVRSTLRKYRIVFIVAGLGLLTFCAFDTVLKCKFVNFDDPKIVNNEIIKSGLTGSSILQAFRLVRLGNWMPLTWLSHMADIEWFGQNPAGHHLHNLILHILNGWLLFFFLREATGRVWLSAVAAMLFAIHPLRVESVAWVAERKDILCGFFGLAALWAYCRYSRNPSVYRYMVVLLLFCLGLMSKPMLVTWPFVMLLLDYWPLGRVRGFSPPFSAAFGESAVAQVVPGRLFLEKIPLFLAAAISSIVTYLVQKETGAVTNLTFLPLSIRLENVVISYASYLGKMIYPHRMAVLYPFHAPISFSVFIVCFILLLAITIWVLCNFRKCPYLFTGWFWYVGTLVPVIGLVQIGRQSMADRYTYLPSIGIVIGLVWLAGHTIQNKSALRVPLGIFAGLAGIFFLIGTWGQVYYWRDSAALFEHTLAVTSGNSVIHQNYAAFLESEGQIEKAITHSREAIRLEPADYMAAVLLGKLFLTQNDPNEAIIFLQKALHSPYSAPEVILGYLGVAYAQKKEYPVALDFLDQALKRKPDYIPALFTQGRIFQCEKKTGQAVDVWKKILALDSSQTEILVQLAWVLATSPDPELNDPSASLQYAIQAAQQTHKDSIGVLDVLAAAYAACGQYERAIPLARKAAGLAQEKKQDVLAAAIQDRITLYQQHKPYQE